MRNAIIGAVLIAILVLTGVTLYSIESKTTRQNELDANLSAAMKSSMEIFTIDPSYSVDRENNEHLVADFIQKFLVRMNSKSSFDIDVYGVDAKKGLLSVGVTETYPTIFSESSVEAKRTIVLDEYVNKEDEYFKVTFYTEKTAEGSLSSPVKQINVYGGSSLAGFTPSDPVKKGYVFKGWKLSGYDGLDGIYKDNFDNVFVTTDLNFVAEWEK